MPTPSMLCDAGGPPLRTADSPGSMAMAFSRGGERERCARAATGVLDDCAARFQAAVFLRGGDHRNGHAVFHAAGGVLPLELHEDRGAVRRDDFAQLNEGRVADRVEDV